MNKISADLPVKLEELCQFTFNFNNLIKIIDYLHQNNLSLQQNIKDMDKRLNDMESLKCDIDDLKIKTINIERSNENLNRSFSNLQENILKYDSKISDIQLKANDIDSRVKKNEIVQNGSVQNLNHLNKIVEDNKNLLNELSDSVNTNTKKIEKISEKIIENNEQNKKEFDNLNNDIKEIKSQFEKEQNEIENINNVIGDTNETIRNMMKDFEKKNSDINDRILNIINDIADLNNEIINNRKMSSKDKDTKDVRSNNNNENNNNNMNMNMSSNVFNIVLDEIEENKNKFNKLKEEYKFYKESQKKEINSLKININELISEYNNLKKHVEENIDNIETIENNFNNYINEKNEENEKIVIDESSKNIDLNSLKIYLNKFVPMDNFKKLSDNFGILTSSVNSKVEREEINVQLKKFNERLENVEMIQQGQTHGPRTRINLGMVNIPFIRSNDSSVPNSEFNDLNEIDYLTKIIEKKINANIINIINKEIENIDFSLNPKINDLIGNSAKSFEDMEKMNKTISDIRNILLSNPNQNDLIALKNDIKTLEKGFRMSNIKIAELSKNLGGTQFDDENDEDIQYNLKGTIVDRINFLNRTCQNLNSKLGSIENRNRSGSKDVKDEIKQNLKNETIKIMQQFKSRLESFTNKFEYELRNKIDIIGLNDFENKMNNKLNIDLKEKIDKHELRKNNNMIKRKIDSLENKISKTLVDTLIDIQMDEQPLIIKNNANGVDICASCNQPKGKNTIIDTEPKDFMPVNVKNIKRVNKLNKSFMNFAQFFNKTSSGEKSFNLNLSLGQKLPDITPSIHQK